MTMFCPPTRSPFAFPPNTVRRCKRNVTFAPSFVVTRPPALGNMHPSLRRRGWFGPLDSARKPGALGASIPVPVTGSLFAAIGLHEREAALIAELHVADWFEPHSMPPSRALIGGFGSHRDSGSGRHVP